MGHRKPWNLWVDGDRVDTVIQVLFRDDQMGPHCCSLVGIGEVIQVVGHCFPTSGIFTLGNAVYHSGHFHELHLDSQSRVWAHDGVTKQSVFSCLEVCAGGGFSSEGISAAGFSLLGGIDQNNRFADIFARAHLMPFVCCDVGSFAALEAAFALSACGGVIMSGINCQPYSIAGDQKKELDMRSASLPKTLELAWLLQVNAVVLECTPAAMVDPFVQSCIREFAALTNMHISQRILKLSNCWASKRDRWWAILTKKVFGHFSFDDLPLMPQFQRVQSIMPYIRHWPDDDLKQLVLSLYEHGKFMDYGGGVAPHFLQMDGVMHTALHAWGNQCYPCRCGCRQGFSEQRMQSRGLHCQLIPSKDMLSRAGETFPCCRYLHPIEVCLLCGSDPSRQVGQDLRLALAAAGQMASPMQSVWVFSHLRKLFQEFFGHGPICHPMDVLKQWQHQVLATRDVLWPEKSAEALVPTRSVPMLAVHDQPAVEVSLHSLGGIQIGSVRVCLPSTVMNLLQAEATLRNLVVEELKAWDLKGNQVDPSMSISEDMALIIGAFSDTPECLSKASVHLGVSQLPSLDFDNDHVHGEILHETGVSEVAPEFSSVKVTSSLDLGLGVPSTGVKTGFHDSSHAEKPFEGTTNDDPLCHLPAASLLQMLGPQVLTQGALSGLRGQMIPIDDRVGILQNQGDIMGDDEMWWHLKAIASHASIDQKVFAWDPLVMTSVAKLRQGHVIYSWTCQLPKECTIITAVVLYQHWIPLVWRKEAHQLLGFTGSISADSLEVVQALHSYVCKLIEVPVTELGVASQLPPSAWCGSVAVQYIRHLLTGIPFREVHESPHQIHCQLQEKFLASAGSQCPRPWIWGRGAAELDEKLSALLRQHGVEACDVPARVDLIRSKLGQDGIQKSMQSGNPWRDLKWHANQCVPPFQLIRPAELQVAIEKRAGSKQPVGHRNHKQKGQGKGSSQQQGVNPDSLRVETGVFHGDGVALEQVHITKIGPIASGVILASIDQALPYLATGKQVSIGALAIIVLNPPSEGLKVPLISEHVKFPVVCAANAEPLIVEGDMYQLGSKPVCKTVSSKPVALKTIDTCVVKLVAFKDMCGEQWSQFVAHPIQTLLHKLPMLVRCTEDGPCECTKFHPDPAVGISDPILELWNRQWLSMNFATAKPSESEMFSVTIRVPIHLQTALLMASGQDGVCAEPRTIDGRKPSEEFFVVWLARTSASQALVLKQTTAKVLGLARLGRKWGLRCRMADASHVHNSVRPDSEFLPAGQKQLFLVGPLPYGALRQSLVEAFREIGWAARPLHALPAARSVPGVMWKVQATSQPPKTVIQLQEGDAVIARFTQAPSESAQPCPVIGAQDTVKICSAPSVGSKGTDPWIHNDPWGSYQPSVASTGQLSGAGDIVMGLEQRVVDAVLAKLPREDMETDQPAAVEGRMVELEQQVQWLAEQQSKLHASFQEQGAVQQAQVSQLQAQFQAQHSQLEAAVQHQSHQLTGLSSSFQAQLDKQESRLDGMFSQQMERIEELLGAKKARRDGSL